MAICGAKTRQGDPCRRAPVPGGNGRCINHGGVGHKQGKDGAPIKHGFYSCVLKGRSKELYEMAEGLHDPLDSTPEIAKLRAILLANVEGRGGDLALDADALEGCRRLLETLARMENAESRRLQNQQVIDQLIADQDEEHLEILGRIAIRRFGAEAAAEFIAEFAAELGGESEDEAE